MFMSWLFSDPFPDKWNKPTNQRSNPAKQWDEAKHEKQPYGRKHEGNTFDCDECDYQCSKLYSLKEHKLNIHEGVTHNCDQC